MSRRTREFALWAVLFAPLVALVAAAGPIAQSAAYHRFADERTFGAIPNALNVLSNLPFLLVGLAGLRLSQSTPGAMRAWRVFFAGTALVCLGSGWYHWSPDNASLVLDRLPMTVAFMGLFVALLAEHLDHRSEIALLVPALVVGVGSVLWWVHSGDLRPYVWVQFGPLLAIPVLLVLFPGQYGRRDLLLYGLACYVAAKAAEHWDAGIYQASANIMSGHSLKHLLAAGAPLCVLRMLRQRASLPIDPTWTGAADPSLHR